ncbi:MAG: 50S ribosomal protein L15 [Verrucomicrobiota bacterium]|jgi:large subunit ribosomal protein L15
MRLHNLQPRPGAKHRRKRLGQGEATGHGKTSGRGGKGQTARSGSSVRIGFEGGQMPLIRRIPKRGFNNAEFATTYIAVNVGDLNQFEDGARVDETALQSVGLANGRSSGVKVLGGGELTKKLTLVVSAISASAKTKVEAKGGSVELLVRKPAAPAKKAAPAKTTAAAKPAPPAKP